MKKLFVFCMVLFLAVAVNAQSPWKGFWTPVNKGFQPTERLALGTSTWLFRPTVSVTALALNYNKELKQIETSPFSKAGLGLSYSHYKSMADGTLYNDFSVSGLVLLNTIGEEDTPTAVNAAITISALQFINLGVGYDFGTRVVFGLLGVVYTFN